MSPEQAEQLGVYLRSKREELGLSVRGLARQAELDNSTVLRLEQGKFLAPGPDKLRRIADVLGLPVNDIFVMADYVVPDELPSPARYFRAKYPRLPQVAVDEMERHLSDLIREHEADDDTNT